MIIIANHWWYEDLGYEIEPSEIPLKVSVRGQRVLISGLSGNENEKISLPLEELRKVIC